MEGEVQINTNENNQEENQDIDIIQQAVEKADGPEEKPQINTRPEGYDLVDPKTATPEQVEKRINYLYKQYKTSNDEAKEFKKVADEQFKLIEELQKGVGAVVDHLQNKTFTETEAQVKIQLKTAYESGDVNAITEASDKLAEIKARKIVAEMNKPKTKPQEQKPAQQEQEFDENAYYPGREVIEAWQAERDESGQFIRPWAFAKTENDQNFAQVNLLTQMILSNPQYQDLSMEQKLAIVDERMGTKKNRQTQAVMGGRLNGGARNGKISISSDVAKYAEKIAIGTGFGGSSVKTDSERVAKYMEQISKVKSKRS